MPLLIIAGVSQGVVTRHKGYRPTFTAWDVVLCHSRKFGVDLCTCWADVLSLANEPSHGGAHIFAFHNVESQRPEFEADVYGRHRLLWMDLSGLNDYGTERFTQLLRCLIKFEEQWRNDVRPRDVRSPLILPEGTFEAKPVVSTLWRRAHKVQRDRDGVSAVTGLAQRFRGEHYLRGCWVDVRDRRFDPGGPRHGIHVPKERQWKFTFEVPEGFHFDVSMERQRPFSLSDHAGVVRNFRRSTNVDCHGFVWGGH